MKKVSIYAILDPRDNSVFYVGATSIKLKYRLSQHIKEGCGKSGMQKRKKDKISSILKSGGVPIIKLLKVVNKCDVDKWKRRYALSFQRKGFELLQHDRFNYSTPPKLSKESARKGRIYKCTDKEYNAAMRRAKKFKFPLSNLIEMVVRGFGQGLDVYFVGGEKPTVTVTLSPKSVKQSSK